MANGVKDTVLRLPFYAKASLIVIGLYFFILMLSIGQNIIVPLLYAMIIAIMLNNMVNFFVKKKMNRVLAIALTMLLATVIVVSVVSALISQAVRFTEAIPLLIDKLLFLLDEFSKWLSQHFNISSMDVDAWLLNIKKELLAYSTVIIGTTINTAGNMLVVVFLIPVLIFMLLYYRPLLIDFLHKLFGSENNTHVSEILTQTRGIIQSYLNGLLVEGAIVAILNATGLLIFKIEYAIILGVIGAILNFIPYLGGVIAAGIFMIVALLTKPPIYVLYVFLLYFIIQLVDNNYIVPKVVGSKVKINAFISILAVICGGALWGIPGMFLSIPLTAILKLIFERIEALKAWGFLIGDTMPPIVKLEIKRKRKSS
jgi:predicted PurR-regulated permease PerM